LCSSVTHVDTLLHLLQLERSEGPFDLPLKVKKIENYWPFIDALSSFNSARQKRIITGCQIWCYHGFIVWCLSLKFDCVGQQKIVLFQAAL